MSAPAVVKLPEATRRRLLALRMQALGAQMVAQQAVAASNALTAQADAARDAEAERLAEEHGMPDAAVVVDPEAGEATITPGAG